MHDLSRLSFINVTMPLEELPGVEVDLILKPGIARGVGRREIVDQRYLRRARKSPMGGECVVVEAARIEPVSTGKFLPTRIASWGASSAAS